MKVQERKSGVEGEEWGNCGVVKVWVSKLGMAGVQKIELQEKAGDTVNHVW